MKNKLHFILLTVLICTSIFIAGCGRDSSEGTIDESITRSNIPSEYHSAIQMFYDEVGIGLGDPVHTVKYDDHTVMFFLDKSDPEDPEILSLSFCKDPTGEYYNGEYYVGAYEIDDIKTCTTRRSDIPAMFYHDPDYTYGSAWIAGPTTMLDELYADRVDKIIKVDDTYSVYIDEDAEDGMDFPTMQKIWAYYRDKGIIKADEDYQYE